ncbi:MAG: insulinase family protein [Clostridia bacterium]|nr:insulinase family protein [Clostridia bacterium]
MIKTTHTPLNPAATLRHTRDTRFKTARLSLVWVFPANAEASPLTTLLFGIYRRGSENYPRLALLNRRLDELYGTTLSIRNYLYGDSHVVIYTAEMPERVFLPPADAHMNILGGVMELLADMVLRPLREANGNLRADAVEKEKQSLCDSLRSLRNDTRAYAGNRLREIMCGGEPYGISIGGTVEQVTAITPAQVTAHHESLLSRVRLEVFYTGRAIEDEVKAAWDAAFGGWEPELLYLSDTSPHSPSESPRAHTEDMEVSQGKLCMGWSCGENFATLRDDPDALAAYAVCNELFGVMQSSLLFRRVREELGLCYFCDSALDMTKGILWVSCGVRPDKREEAEAAIRAELTALQGGRISPADVELAKLSLQNAYRQMGDSQASLEIFALNRLLNGTPDTPEEELSRVMNVTLTDVARVAATFKPDTVFFLNGTAEGEEEDYDDGY